jgi:hypothetical protein
MRAELVRLLTRWLSDFPIVFGSALLLFNDWPMRAVLGYSMMELALSHQSPACCGRAGHTFRPHPNTFMTLEAERRRSSSMGHCDH